MVKLDYFQRKLDDKNRLTIPAECRLEFKGGGVVITRGFKNYLHLYSQEVWDAQMEPALAGDILDERIADLNVQFRTGKQSALMDQKQGRITIDQHLLEYAGIKKDIAAIRIGNYWRLQATPDALHHNGQATPDALHHNGQATPDALHHNGQATKTVR